MMSSVTYNDNKSGNLLDLCKIKINATRIEEKLFHQLPPIPIAIAADNTLLCANICS